jgi:hypothetical protein
VLLGEAGAAGLLEEGLLDEDPLLLEGESLPLDEEPLSSDIFRVSFEGREGVSLGEGALLREGTLQGVLLVVGETLIEGAV